MNKPESVNASAPASCSAVSDRHPVVLVECHCHTIHGFIVHEWRAETRWELVKMFLKLWLALRPPSDKLSGATKDL